MFLLWLTLKNMTVELPRTKLALLWEELTVLCLAQGALCGGKKNTQLLRQADSSTASSFFLNALHAVCSS